MLNLKLLILIFSTRLTKHVARTLVPSVSFLLRMNQPIVFSHVVTVSQLLVSHLLRRWPGVESEEYTAASNNKGMQCDKKQRATHIVVSVRPQELCLRVYWMWLPAKCCRRLIVWAINLHAVPYTGGEQRTYLDQTGLCRRGKTVLILGILSFLHNVGMPCSLWQAVDADFKVG